MKKCMVRCDLEGVTGVVSYGQAEPGGAEYAFGRARFMGDLLALIEGLQAGGVEEILIYDEHCDGRNIDLGCVPAGVSAICGKPPYRADWAGGLDESFDGMILLGLHSKAGTPGGLLPHSYELDIRELTLNDVSVGEIGMEAAIAGDTGVPTVLVVGDSAGTAEAEALLPGVVIVSVKAACGATGARCDPACVTAKKIRDAARQVVERPPAVAAYRVERPVSLTVELNEGPYLAAVRKRFGNRLSGNNRLVLEGGSATEVWAAYWRMKLQAQAVIS